jgi:NTP pyrophosphatase (non-canonical NTP hydrolase)
MEFAEYQTATRSTDQRPGTELEDITVHLLGLAGEAGSVASQYKKKLRDKESHSRWKHHIREELGDVLWYVSTLATKLDLDLNEVAEANLEKTRSRWLPTDAEQLDAGYPAEEQLPRSGKYEFVASINEEGRPTVHVRFDGGQVGDPLTDASHVDDGYRFHDVFHLAHATVLGWSPVTRSLLKRKRRTNREVDEAEDGGRAIVIEEGVAALVFAYATSHNYLEGITRLDQQLLDSISMLVGGTEVGVRSAADWERAILTGYDMFRQLRDHDGGTVSFEADSRSMTFQAPA